jgi:hypothetical protein
VELQNSIHIFCSISRQIYSVTGLLSFHNRHRSGAATEEGAEPDVVEEGVTEPKVATEAIPEPPAEE